MSMPELERNLHRARKQMNEMIGQLADAAIEDSSIYSEAIKKLREFKWSFIGPSAQTMIDAAIEMVERRALALEIQEHC